MKKICSKCKEEKSFDDFNKQKNGKFGLQSYCRDCAILARKKYQKKNKEKLKEYKKNTKRKIKKK